MISHICHLPLLGAHRVSAVRPGSAINDFVVPAFLCRLRSAISRNCAFLANFFVQAHHFVSHHVVFFFFAPLLLRAFAFEFILVAAPPRCALCVKILRPFAYLLSAISYSFP